MQPMAVFGWDCRVFFKKVNQMPILRSGEIHIKVQISHRGFFKKLSVWQPCLSAIDRTAPPPTRVLQAPPGSVPPIKLLAWPPRAFHLKSLIQII